MEAALRPSRLASAARVNGMAWLGGIAVGAVFFGGRVFAPGSPAFQFVMVGFGLAVFLTLFQTGGSRHLIIAFPLLFLLDLILAGNRFAGTRLVFWGWVLLAVFLFFRFYAVPLRSPFFARTLVYAGLLALAYLLATLLLWLIFRSRAVHVDLFRNLPMGFLLGIGQGMGLELGEKFFSAKKH